MLFEEFISKKVEHHPTLNSFAEGDEANLTGFLNDKAKLVTCDAMAAMLAIVISAFGIIFAVRDHAVSMGRAQRVLPSR